MFLSWACSYTSIIPAQGKLKQEFTFPDFHYVVRTCFKSQRGPGWPGTHCGEEAGLKLPTNSPAILSQVLELTVTCFLVIK